MVPVLSVGLGLPLEDTATLLQTEGNADRKLLLMTEEVMKTEGRYLQHFYMRLKAFFASLFLECRCFGKNDMKPSQSPDLIL